MSTKFGKKRRLGSGTTQRVITGRTFTISPGRYKKVPLQMRVKGFLVDEIASLGATVRIKTTTDRIISGILIDINPKYTHNFGEPVPELINAGVELRKLMEEIDRCDGPEGDGK